MSVVLPAVAFEYRHPSLFLKVPDQFRDHVGILVRKLPAPYLKVSLDRPMRPRTTGKDSQNNWVNGAVQFISQSSGEEFETVKMRCKARAVSMGYPFDTTFYMTPQGVRVEMIIPRSESKVSVEDDSILIQSIQMDAAEAGIFLPEEYNS